MASFPRAKVDSSTQTDPPLPFTALLDRTLDRVEATVPLNLSSITFYIRRHHLSRIEQIEALLSENFFFKAVLFPSISPPTSVRSPTQPTAPSKPSTASPLPLRAVSASNQQSMAPSTLPADPIALTAAAAASGPVGSAREDSMQSSNSYSSSQEDFDDSRRSEASSWGRPSDYSNYSEDNITSTSYSGSMTVEEKMKQRMRRRWAKFSQTRKDKATRQWLAYWSIYGTVQVIDTWSSFLLDWIPGYNLGKLLFLWWAQRRGATLVFDYFQPLIQSKNKDGREVARKPSNRSLNSEMSRHERGGSSGGPSGSRPTSIQMLPSALAQQHQQQHQQYQQQQPQYQQQQFEQQFYGKGGASRRDTATFRDLNQGRRRREDYYEDEEDENDFHDHRNYQQQFIRDQQKQHQQPLDLRRELMNSSPHDSGAFAETPLFESAESVWSAPPISTSMLAVDDIGGMTRMATHSNNATPTPMSVQEQYLRLHQVHQQQQQAQKSLQPLSQDANSYAVASTIHWNPSTSTSATSTD
ncbi:hypothetical protein BGZ54_000870 [Gamsiella multidivaricata]|nr:hypothetical protein BGZ54_000870 [Gamsiella multidivaricata]